MDKKTLEFTVFLIHALADEWKKPYRVVYQILNANCEVERTVLRSKTDAERCERTD